MKICHVITRMIVGGAQENTLATALGLAARGHEVTLLTGPGTGPEGSLLDVSGAPSALKGVRLVVEPHLVRPVHPLRDALALRALEQHFRRETYDIVHTHSSKAGIVGRTAAWRARARGAPLIVHTIHGLAFDAFQPWWKNRLFIALERRCARHTDALISVCDAMTRQALAAGVGQPAQYQTIYSGTDFSAYPAAQAARGGTRALLGCPADAFVLGFAGRLFALKGAEEFVRIVHAASEAARAVHGVIIGGGPLRAQLEAQARAWGLGDRMHFTGLVPPEAVPRMLCAADLVVHASLREGLARVIVQSLALGVPVAAYDVGGAREVLVDGENGIVCAAGDERGLTARVREAVADDALRGRLANGARRTDVSRFDVRRMVGQIEGLYMRLAAAACPGRQGGVQSLTDKS
ncbi:glycosyltransferase family 4 protein [bacterium]|nr:glycosyltransferase family 4 protein [bacterium]